MKSIKHIILFLAVLTTAATFSSCEEEDVVNNGEPVIHYVRITNPESSDSLLVAGYLGNLVAIIGDNLGDTRELWFDDNKAVLNPNFVTDESIIVSIPNAAPGEVTDELTLKFGNGSSLKYDFGVAISDPVVNTMRNEYGAPGSTTNITGDFFFEPMTITFNGGVQAEILAVEQTMVEFAIPEGAEPGPVTVSTNFGTTESVFHYRDQRNIILNYDDLTAAGSWRPGPTDNVDGLDGNYLKLFGTLDANERIEDNFESQFWGNTRYETPQNLFEGRAEDHALKFEARVVEWEGSYLQICWGPWDNANNGEVWGNLNGRGLWRPWEDVSGVYSTDGEWITVTIPLTEMQYSHNQDTGDNAWVADMEFDEDIAGTLSFWVIATPEADGSPVEIHIDNVRIVEN